MYHKKSTLSKQIYFDFLTYTVDFNNSIIRS